MTHENWRPVAALIDNLWKDEFDEAREAAYLAALAHYSASEVQSAVLAIAGRPGGAWAPSCSEIAAEIHAQRYIGTWAWVREVLSELVRSYLHDDPEFAVALVNRRANAMPAPLAAAIAGVHSVYGPLVCTLVEERGLSRLWRERGRWDERQHQRSWANLVLGVSEPVAQIAEAPTSIRPVH